MIKLVNQLASLRNPKVPSIATLAGHLVSMLEPHRTPCLLKGLESMVIQVELNELCHYFHVPHTILIRVPETG